MKNVEVVEGLEAADYLDHNLPDVLLLHELFMILALTDALENVTVVRELHHDA